MPHTLRTFPESIDNRVLHITDEVDPISRHMQATWFTDHQPLDISIPKVGDEYTVMRIGGKMAIDATKPPTWRTKERARFARVDPMGKRDATLQHLVEQVRQSRQPRQPR